MQDLHSFFRCWSVRVSENDLYLFILRMCIAIKFTTFNLNIVFTDRCTVVDVGWQPIPNR